MHLCQVHNHDGINEKPKSMKRPILVDENLAYQPTDEKTAGVWMELNWEHSPAQPCVQRLSAGGEKLRL